MRTARFWYVICTHSLPQKQLHTEEPLKYTDPPSALGFWIALQECTSKNGALSFLPGSHLTSPITKRFVRLPGGGTGFEQLLVNGEASPPSGDFVLQTCQPGTMFPHSPFAQITDHTMSQVTWC